jgi:bifunctional non-homologous end joining protein LigD
LAKKLSKYRAKRDPGRTTEPFGAEPMSSPGAAQPGTLAGAFVVHLHDATRRHYDLRIEFGGVLKSFAVPRGPSLDPREKRLAVNTEDHPIEYLDFEAVIPAGNYGAGSMILWDRGAIRYLEQSAEQGLSQGKIDFTLHGHKLRGRFALVKVSGRRGQPEPRQPEWLLLKKVDAFSRETSAITDEQPRSVLSGLTVDELANAGSIALEIEREALSLGAVPLATSTADFVPMLSVVAASELVSPGWLYELKLDGVRILAHRDPAGVALRYRTGRSASESYPEVVRAVSALAAPNVTLDGEIIAVDERGRPDFQKLSKRIHATRTHEARQAAREVPVSFVVFDVLTIGQLDLRRLPLRDRKRLLARIVPGQGTIRTLDHIEEDGRPLWEFCAKFDLEGVIAKRADSAYVLGPRRTGDWIKVKRDRDDEFVVVGFTRGEGTRDALGALELASFTEQRLIYRGRVGSGLDDASIPELLARLRPLVQAEPSAEGEFLEAPRGRSNVAAEIVVSVRHSGFTHDGRLRHPVFRGVREDVVPEACLAAPDDERVEAALRSADSAHRGAPAKLGGRVKLSNQDKIFWPDEGYTKGELCRYYAEISDTVLPYLRNRPVLMVRYPDGVTGKNFFQWRLPSGTPGFVRGFAFRSDEHAGREVMSCLVDDQDTLLYLANLACIPLHILASRADDLERCDFLTIDFDLGGCPLQHAVELAHGLRTLLEQIGLRGFPKTSGQTGLHVLVPLGGVPFALSKALAELLGRILHARHPTISTVERMRAKRPRAVYIDTGQTGRSRAIVAPYSVRAFAGARVSTPLGWDEVSFSLDPSQFTMFTVPDRIRAYGDPMAGMLDQRPDVAASITALEPLLHLR